MSLHREHYVTQSDLQQTVFFSPSSHMKETKQSHQELSRPLQKVWHRRGKKKKKKSSVSVCQQGSKKELSFQHLQTNRWMTLDLKIQLLLVWWSLVFIFHLSTLHTTLSIMKQRGASPERAASDVKVDFAVSVTCSERLRIRGPHM